MGSKRAMFVWLPNFAMTLARAKHPPLAAPHEPLALLEKHGAIKRVAALDEPAIRAGIYLHQPLADALAVYPKLICADAAPDVVEGALAALTAWAQRYSPATAPAPPDGLWLDITGCAHLWGGEERLAEDLIARLEARGVPARAAIAPTFGAAYALAHHARRSLIIPPHPTPLPPGEMGQVESVEAASLLPSASACGCGHLKLQSRQGEIAREKDRMRGSYNDNLVAMLSPLPVERLRISEETASVLRKLGLSTIGDVQKQPRAGLARRFPDLLPQLDKAIGLAPEAIAFLQPPTPWVERMRFADPIAAPEDLERATLTLLYGLCARLQAKRQGGKLFEASFFRSDGGVEIQTVKTALPVRDAARIFRLFREKLGLVDPGFGVDVVALAAAQVEPLEAQQANILRKVKSAACAEDLAVLIDALENRLGEGRVYRLGQRESYIPERAVKRMPVIPETPQALSGISKHSKRPQRKDPGYRQTGSGMMAEWPDMERPIRLFLLPQPIDVTAAIPDAPPALFRWRKVVHRVVRAEGPERIAPEWWRDDGGEEEPVRDYYRVESEHGMRFWVFREGLYGGERLPRWYLQGVFA